MNDDRLIGPGWYIEGRQNVWLPYTQMKTVRSPLAVASASGSRLELTDGRTLIDGVSSWWTTAHGYRHPHIIDAIQRQAATLPHVMLGGLAHEQAYRLASRLAALLPGELDHVFYSESGSVSVEVAMKMAAQYWLAKGERRPRFASLRFGYHGDTFATMSVCDPEEGMHTMFRGMLADQLMLPLPTTPEARQTFDRMLDKQAGTIAAILVEPRIQGAGGMRFHSHDTLRHIREGCERHDILLIFDEIFVGFCRTGEAMFACEAAGVTPDIITLSKALTGGTLPLAATIASRRVYEAFLSDLPGRALMHGPTYMGNAMACAAANASLDLFETEPRLTQARAIEECLRTILSTASEIPGVADVRALGAVGVIELDRPVDTDWFSGRCAELGVWLRPFGNIVYTAPPLPTGIDEVAHIAATMVASTREFLRQGAGNAGPPAAPPRGDAE